MRLGELAEFDQDNWENDEWEMDRSNPGSPINPKKSPRYNITSDIEHEQANEGSVD